MSTEGLDQRDVPPCTRYCPRKWFTSTLHAWMFVCVTVILWQPHTRGRAWSTAAYGCDATVRVCVSPSLDKVTYLHKMISCAPWHGTERWRHVWMTVWLSCALALQLGNYTFVALFQPSEATGRDVTCQNIKDHLIYKLLSKSICGPVFLL